MRFRRELLFTPSEINRMDRIKARMQRIGTAIPQLSPEAEIHQLCIGAHLNLNAIANYACRKFVFGKHAEDMRKLFAKANVVRFIIVEPNVRVTFHSSGYIDLHVKHSEWWQPDTLSYPVAIDAVVVTLALSGCLSERSFL